MYVWIWTPPRILMISYNLFMQSKMVSLCRKMNHARISTIFSGGSKICWQRGPIDWGVWKPPWGLHRVQWKASEGGQEANHVFLLFYSAYIWHNIKSMNSRFHVDLLITEGRAPSSLNPPMTLHKLYIFPCSKTVNHFSTLTPVV